MTRRLHPPLSHTQQRRRWIASALAGTAGLLLQPGFAHAAVDPATVAEPQRTKAVRYLTAADTPAFIQAQGGTGKVLFLDLRTRAEAMYVGMATGIGALVPFVEHQEPMTDWDVQRGIYCLADDGYTQMWLVAAGAGTYVLPAMMSISP